MNMRNKALQLSMISILVFLFTAVLRVMLFKYGDYILEINVPCPHAFKKLYLK